MSFFIIYFWFICNDILLDKYLIIHSVRDYRDDYHYKCL